jgi:methylmalonyl-CoA mutase
MAKTDELHFPEAGYDDWRREVERTLKGASFDKKLVTHTWEGIEVQPLYTADDWPWEQNAGGFPGAAPYRRGALAVGQSGRREMRARYDNPDHGALGVEIAADLARGAHSLWLCFDRAVRAGENPDAAPRAARERGVACVSAEHLAGLLEAVPLDRVAVSLDAGGNALALAACFFATAAQRGLDPQRLEGWLNADPLAALARDGALPCTLDFAHAQLVALARYALEHAPRVRAVTVSSVPYHDAGADAVQEIAYALATGVTYLRWLDDDGVSLRDACAQLGFSVSVGSDFFMEIAKLRALRQCWASVIAACGGDEGAQTCVIHALTSTRSKSARDPWVNMLRETTEAFAAAVAGADAVTTCGFDRLLGVSDAFARRIAGNAQVILDEEANVSRVADPAGGSWYVETLTDQLAERALRCFQEIEAKGGMAAVLGSGEIAARIARVAGARDAALAKRKQAITGVSEFAKVDEAPVARPEPDWQAIDAARRSALARTSRGDEAVKPLVDAVRAGRGVVEAAIEAAKRGASIAQLSRAAAGADRGAPTTTPEALPLRRHAAPFERLRDASDLHTRTQGSRPSVFLCNIGAIETHKARAQFATGFCNAGGLLALDNDGFESPPAAAEAFARSGSVLAVLCGSDDAYPEWVPALTPLLLQCGAKRVLLAGRPGEHEARFRAAGVSDFIFMGSDAVVTLAELLAAIGAAPQGADEVAS